MTGTTLSCDDLALAQFACAHAISWVKAQGKTAYWRAERLKFEALNAKLSALSNRAETPARDHEDERVYFFETDLASKPVMRLDLKAIRKLHAKARKART